MVGVLYGYLPYVHGFTGMNHCLKNKDAKIQSHPSWNIRKDQWRNQPFGARQNQQSNIHRPKQSIKAPMNSFIVSMSYNDEDNEGPALLTVLGVVFAIVILVGTSISPTLDMVSGTGGSNDYNIADSVVTRQDSMEKRKEYSSANANANASDKLSRSKIQEKLNRVPVFYIADSNGNMNSNIYLSYLDASNAIGDLTDVKVKCTTLDQVT